MKPYKIINEEWIKLIEGPYAGIMYKYGRVQLIEEDEQLRVKFDYELDSGERMGQDFIQYIGPILIEMMDEGIAKNSITYTGGTDVEN